MSELKKDKLGIRQNSSSMVNIDPQVPYFYYIINKICNNLPITILTSSISEARKIHLPCKFPASCATAYSFFSCGVGTRIFISGP